MRATRAAGLALSTGTYAAPALSTAISAAIVHGVFAARTPTRSPGLQPCSTRACASRLADASSSP